MNTNADIEPRENIEPQKTNPQLIDGVIGYVANSVVSKTIVDKPTTTISLLSFDNGEGMIEKTCPFDNFFHILEGHAEIVIDKVSHLLESGEGIIVPANTANFIKPNGRFKMILTIIKNQDERIAIL